MADSLFDNRYRYDFIYPRGRSGETLRAVDTQDNDRPVVIKRPAPNDAPPIRAGQEVSILNERKALTRLSGQPTITALLGGGQFFVGGIPHQYVVMERAEGMVIGDLVLELAARGERLPELEMLVIVDRLLDVLSAAHAHDIVYNDVDAKHLFWDRDNYRLKIIDWGNAVFLEGDESTPQGVSRQSDIYQVGELLYFIVCGGGRIEMPRDAGDDFRLDFGHDAERVHTRLQTIITRAVHPNLRLRYRTIDELRKDLADYRSPVERERNAILGRVTERLRRDRSKDELNSLLKALEPALAMDPGFPQARELQRDIADRLSNIEVGADVDAARIYLESGNWARAWTLLDELRLRAKGDTAILIALLLDWAYLLNDAKIHPPPSAVPETIPMLFEGQISRAAYALLMQEDERENARHLQLLLAERISAHLPDILLLRPNLHRLDTALAELAREEIPLDEPRAVLREVWAELDAIANVDAINLVDLRDRYRALVDQLTALSTLVEAVNAAYRLPNRRLPLSSLERALNAAMTLADNMHVIGKQATASPRDATSALDSSRAIDPINPIWDMVAHTLDSLYELLGGYQIYVPAADGSDLEGWLQNTQRDLQPYADRLFDEMLVGIIKGLSIAEFSWENYAVSVIQGSRIGAITALAQAADAVSTVSPTLASWFNQLRSLITNAQYIERHALYGGLGRALADGWEAYDRGRLADAERLGAQAYEIARNDSERFAARRLRELSETTRGWVERNGINDPKRTEQTLATIELLYTSEENTTRNNFTAQMPSKETYLKAMGKALVEMYARHSTAAVRLLFFNFVLLGALDAHEGALDDAAFWREAAVRTLGDNASKHAATRALDDFVERRRDLNMAAEMLNRFNSRNALMTLETTRKMLEDNPQSRTLSAATYGLREIEAALRDWSDGEFRPAGIKLENALKAIDEVETQAQVTLTNYRAWLMELIAGAAELHNYSRQMMQIIDGKPDAPNDAVRAAHHRLVEMTTRLLGEAYAASLRQWRDTYEAFLAVYADRNMRRSAKLNRFNELFRAMFIDRHPAYPLYRHWYDVTDQSPEFPPPPTDEPTPHLTEAEDAALDEFPLPPLEPVPEPVARRRGGRFPFLVVAVLLLAVTALAVVFTRSGAGVSPSQPVTAASPGVAGDPEEPAAASADSTEEAVAVEPSATSASGFTFFTAAPPRETADFTTPSLVPTQLPGVNVVTQTLISRALPTTPAEVAVALSVEPTTAPTDAPAPTETSTPQPTFTPSVTLPPEGLTGEQDLLSLASALPGADAPWTAEQFVPQPEDDAWRLGIGAEIPGSAPMVTIRLPADLLDARFGNHAASRVVSAEATMALITYVPSLLQQQQVYFGALLASPGDPTQTIGMQVVVPQPGIINIGQRQGETVEMTSQRSVTAVVIRIRLQRDPVTGVVTVFYNNDQVGQPVLFVGPDDPVEPVLFVRNGGVIVSVTDWTITLQ